MRWRRSIYSSMLIPLPLHLAVLGVVVANAFMIPSTMSVPDMKDDGLDAFGSYDIGRISDQRGVSGFLDCAGCEWPGPASFDIDSSALLLNFVSAEDSKTILFNSVPIYPLASPLVQLPLQPVDVQQRGFNHQGATTIDRSLRYSRSDIALQFHTDDRWRSIAFNITIESLDEKSVSLPPLQVHILEDIQTGTFRVLRVFVLFDNEMIATLDMIPRPTPKTLPRPVLQPTQSCSSGPFSMFCRLKNYLTAKFSSTSPPPRRLGGCRGRTSVQPPHIKGGPAKYWRFGEDAGNMRIQPMPFQPHSQPPNGFMRYLHVFAISVIIPVLIGIAAGLCASLLGLIFGTLVAWFWIKFIRSNKLGRVAKGEVNRCDIASKEEQWVEADGLLGEKVEFPSHEERQIAEPPPGYVEKE